MTEVDQAHPWPGLASFSEETRAFFHGRDEEVAELARRVQRKLLTVLFGQSGLGKTSILRAGIVPRLRGQGYCPVYVRIDYGPAAPPPAEQVKLALMQAARWRGPVPDDGDSLWELLHRRDAQLVDADDNPVIPLFIFDQFEEIFTLAQGDDGGRGRAARFVEQLAELVENRPPRALEARLEDDDSIIERLDFARADYRVLIALREDYLAHLEGLKGEIPSIIQNRMRLAPMTGQQALAAVRGPGAALVDDEVAAAIVRFVAGGAEVAHAQVEPSLLSLICRELNDARIAAGRSEISLDLLAGSHASILSDFYERALAGQPAAVRKLVEDLLLTDSGYRENVAEERVRQALAAAGAAPGTLAELVNRRLLRIEERLDLRRVELTHDVLCPVVRASRDLRQEREAREAGERALAEQQARERATRRSLARTRQVAAGCVLLALGAISASVYAYVASAQASQAERSAQLARAASARSQGQAELLVGYLNDDFARELDGMASKEAQVGLSKRILEYYDRLPNVEPGSDTERNREVALIRYATAARFLGRMDEAEQLLKKALRVLEQRRAAGDRSEATAAAIGLGLLGEQSVLWGRGEFAGSRNALLAAAKLLAPWALRANATPATLRLYGLVMNSLVVAHAGRDEGLAAYEAARAAFTRLGGTSLRDTGAAIDYVRATGIGLVFLDRDDMTNVGTKAYDLGTQLLKLRPGDFAALRARAYVATGLAVGAIRTRQLDSALARSRDAAQDYSAMLRLDPGDTNVRDNLATMQGTTSLLLERTGQPQLALEAEQASVATIMAARRPPPPDMGSTLIDGLAHLALLHEDLGEPAASAADLAQARKAIAVQLRAPAEGRAPDAKFMAPVVLAEARIATAGGHPEAALQSVQALQAMWRASTSGAVITATDPAFWMAKLNLRKAQALLAQGQPAQALTVLAVSANVKPPPAAGADVIEPLEDLGLALATAQLDAGRRSDARDTLARLLPQQRAFVAANPHDCRGRLQLAALLALQARAEPAAAAAAAREAAALIKALPKPMERLRSVRRQIGEIEAAIQTKGTA